MLRRISPAIWWPSACSSWTERVPQPTERKRSGRIAAARDASRRILEKVPGIEVAELSQRVGHVADHEQHRAVEGRVVDDRDVVALGELEEVVLDPADRVEVLEVAVRRALLRADGAGGEAVAQRVLVERA